MAEPIGIMDSMTTKGLRKSSVAVSAVLLIGIAVSGCGSGGGSNGSTADAKDASATESTSAPEAAGPEATTATSTAGTGDTKTFCASYRGMESKMTSLTESSDQASMTAALIEWNKDMQNITPPSVISADWTTLSTVLGQMLTVLKKVPADDPNAAQKRKELSKSIDMTAFKNSSRSIDSWAQANCK